MNDHKPIKSVKEVNYPDGIYDGTWSGYVVSFSKYKGCFEVDMGVRNPLGAPVKIIIKNKQATIKLLN
jgi:hypothetical protein